MAIALEYLLMSRLREETNIAGPKYLVWQALFPKGFASVTSKGSKSSNLGSKSPDKVLCDFADEWADDQDKADLVEVAYEIGAHARRVGGAGDEEAHVLMQALSERLEDDGRLSRAKVQLVDAVVECLTRHAVTVTYESNGRAVTEDVGCALASVIEDGYLDPWRADLGFADEVPTTWRGLAFLFSSEFKDAYIELLGREFGWKDDYYFAKFASELEACQWSYMSGELEDDDELKLMRSVLAMYVLAGLVGPGTFAGELGCATSTVGTLRGGDDAFPIAHERVVRYQLQPIVFTGRDSWSYYTDVAEPIVFTSKEIVRFGRTDDSDPHWLEEYRGVAIGDRSVSRKHAQLEHRGLEWCLTDLGSANGTIVIRGYRGGKIFRVAGFTDIERRIRVSTGDLFFFGPKAGYQYDTDRRPMATPEVEPFVRGKAFRFERIER